MWGRGSYSFHRHTGRIMRDSSMRMSNRAEVGFGMVGMMFFIILFLTMIWAIF